MYHYTECGLQNVWLVNGYEELDTLEGKAVSVSDVDGLHQVIAKALFEKGTLTGMELRFVRRELDLSQSGLGKLLGTSEQNVRLWEKNGSITAPSFRLLKLLYLDHTGVDSSVREIIEEIAETDRQQGKSIKLEHEDQHWLQAA